VTFAFDSELSYVDASAFWHSSLSTIWIPPHIRNVVQNFQSLSERPVIYHSSSRECLSRGRLFGIFEAVQAISGVAWMGLPLAVSDNLNIIFTETIARGGAA
jgi:hypothetical protein